MRNAMNGVETVDPSGLEGCEAYKCAYNLLNNSNNSLFCETIGLFDGNGLHHLSFEVKTPEKGGAAETEWNSAGNTALMRINPNECNTTFFEAAATILHEAIHTLLFIRVSEEGLDPNDPENYIDVWSDFAADYYLNVHGEGVSTETIQHSIMIYNEYWVRKLAEALWNAGGQNFTIDHYMHTAWDGLRGYSYDYYHNDPFGTNSPYHALHLERINNQNDPLCE
jgi:hypothetical protein